MGIGRGSLATFGVLALATVLLAGGRIEGQTRSNTILRVSGATPGASVVVDGIFHGRADAQGVLAVETIPAGRHTVVIRQTGFVDTVLVVALSSGRTASAVAKRVPLKDPAELALQHARDLALDGKNEAAATGFQAAVDARVRPYPDALIGLCRVLTTLKHTEEATAAANAAVAAEPKNIEAHTVLGTVLRERGLYDESAAEYRRAIVLGNGRAPEAHTGLAVTLAEQGDHAGAVDEYRIAIAQNQDAEPILYQLLGTSLEHVGRPTEAIAAYRRFLALAPGSNLAPAVRSVVERLEQDKPMDEEGDVNPYAPKTP